MQFDLKVLLSHSIENWKMEKGVKKYGHILIDNNDRTPTPEADSYLYYLPMQIYMCMLGHI